MEEIRKELQIIRNQLSKIQNDSLSGYPSIDKPWEKFYDMSEFNKAFRKKTVYQEVYDNNKDYKDDLAIEYLGGTKINFEKFFDKIDSVSKSFEEYGIKKGDFVTICSAGVPEAAFAFYALSKIGAVGNMIAPHFEKKDFIDRIEDCESDTLIVMDVLYDEIKEAVKKSRIKNVIVLPALNSSVLKYISKKYKLEKHSNELYWDQFIKDGLHRNDSVTVPYETDMPLAMVYSSGTTGASKGILLSNDSFQNSIHAYPASGVDISRGQKFYQIIPFWYSTGLNTSLHLPLSYGSSVFMDPRFERDVFVKNVLNAKPNYAVAPTSMYEGFLDEKLVGNKNLSFFNYPFEGGEPLSGEVASNIENVFRQHGSTAKLRVAYGQCEAGAAITTQTQRMDSPAGSVGIPLPGITIGIFDDNFNELKYNQRGQILADTPCRMIGYFHNQEGTDEYFHIDKNGVKWNCTGDIGYIDKDGNLFVEGRTTDYTMVNNKKIYNFDIEKILMQLNEIKICDVVDKNDSNGQSLLAVHLIFQDDFNKKIEEDSELLMSELLRLQKHIFDATGDIDMVPYVFKIRNNFPYAKSGKRDVLKLKQENEGFIILEQYESDPKIKRLS